MQSSLNANLKKTKVKKHWDANLIVRVACNHNTPLLYRISCVALSESPLEGKASSTKIEGCRKPVILGRHRLAEGRIIMDRGHS